jgi:WD40 repeat protein
VAGYEILGELGHGGMGIVYKARQTRLHRLVALKMLAAGAQATARDLARFRLEAEAAARMQHPHIVQIYDIGEADGRPYLALEFVEGGSLASKIRGNPQPVEVAARLVEALARAMYVAHQNGIVHRDLKPSNVLLALDSGREATGRKGGPASDPPSSPHWSRITVPKITDFGLAKRLEGAEAWTQTGEMVGTPSYMAPEQAAGTRQPIGPATDVYALGAILYEMLTGRPPFQAETALDTVLQVMYEEPVSPGRLRPKLPRDLETICLKCLVKEPSRRYASAEALADDLRRFQDGKSIQARPVSSAERLWQWGRRNKALAASLVAVALLLVMITVGAIALAAYFRKQETVQRGLVHEKAELADRNQKLAEDNQSAREIAEGALRQAENTLVDMQTSRGLLAGEQDQAALAVLWFAKAAETAASDPQRRADDRLRARNWARNAILPVRAFSLGGYPRMMEFRPGGDLLLMRTDTGVFVWDWPAEKPLSWADGKANASAACWSPDGAYLALGLPSGEVQIRSVPGGAMLHQLQHPGAVTALAFSPNGRYLAAASNVVRIWDAQTHEFLKADWKHPLPVDGAIFNGASDRLATACQDKKARVFAVPDDPARPAPLFDPVTHNPTRPSPPAFIDAHGLVTITGDKQLTWWDIESGKPERLGVITTKVNSMVRVVASPRRNGFATGGHYGPEVWNLADGSAKAILLNHKNLVEDFVFSPDGTTLLSVSWDNTARLWSLPDGRALGSPLAHLGTVARCAFSSDNVYLATCQANGLVHIWKRPADEVVQATPGPHQHDGSFFQARVSGNGLLVSPGLWHEAPLAYGSFGSNRLVVLDATTGTPVGPPIPLEGVLVDSCVCADNRSVAALSLAGNTGWLSMWDVATGRALFPPKKLPEAPVSVAPRPHGSHVAVLCQGGELLVFDGRDGQVVFDLRHEGWGSAYARKPKVEYTPDGATLVTLTKELNSAIHVRDAETGRLRYPPIRPVLEGGPCRTFTVSADSRLLATAVNGKNAAQVWDLTSGRALSRPLLHPGDIIGLFTLRFSPDGQHLLTGSRDGQARWWDWKADRLACPPLQHGEEVFCVAITADGRHAVTGTRGPFGPIHFWELKTGKPVAPPLLLSPAGSLQGVYSVSISPDGKRVLAGVNRPNGVAVIHLDELLSPPTLPTEDLRLLGELALAQRIELGDVSGLNMEQWMERFHRFRNKYPEFGRLPLEEALAVHREAARMLLETDRPLAAIAHLRQALVAIDRARMAGPLSGKLDPERARWLAYLSVLAPGPLPEKEQQRLLEAAARAGDYHKPRLTAAVHFRAGRLKEAVDLFAQNPGGPEYMYLAAMAHQKRGRHDQAKTLLAQANDWMKQQRAKDPGAAEPSPYHWLDWTAVLILQREAEALIDGKAPSEAPTRSERRPPK